MIAIRKLRREGRGGEEGANVKTLREEESPPKKFFNSSFNDEEISATCSYSDNCSLFESFDNSSNIMGYTTLHNHHYDNESPVAMLEESNIIIEQQECHEECYDDYDEVNIVVIEAEEDYRVPCFHENSSSKRRKQFRKQILIANMNDAKKEILLDPFGKDLQEQLSSIQSNNNNTNDNKEAMKSTIQFDRNEKMEKEEDLLLEEMFLQYEHFLRTSKRSLEIVDDSSSCC